MTAKLGSLQVRLDKKVAENFTQYAKSIGKSRSQILRDYAADMANKVSNSNSISAENSCNNLTTKFVISLNESEAKAFELYASEIGENRSRLLRKIIRELINNPYPDLLSNEQAMIRVVIRYLAGISRNLNQITAAINTGKLSHRNIDKNYLDEIKKYVDDVKSEFLTYLEITRKRLIVNKE